MNFATATAYAAALANARARALAIADVIAGAYANAVVLAAATANALGSTSPCGKDQGPALETTRPWAMEPCQEPIGSPLVSFGPCGLSRATPIARQPKRLYKALIQLALFPSLLLPTSSPALNPMQPIGL
jgi:hypothetical protein